MEESIALTNGTENHETKSPKLCFCNAQALKVANVTSGTFSPYDLSSEFYDYFMVKSEEALYVEHSFYLLFCNCLPMMVSTA